MTTARATNALELLELHLRCLYAHDPVGRIQRTREPGGRESARFSVVDQTGPSRYDATTQADHIRRNSPLDLLQRSIEGHEAMESVLVLN